MCCASLCESMNEKICESSYFGDSMNRNLSISKVIKLTINLENWFVRTVFANIRQFNKFGSVENVRIHWSTQYLFAPSHPKFLAILWEFTYVRLQLDIQNLRASFGLHLPNGYACYCEATAFFHQTWPFAPNGGSQIHEGILISCTVNRCAIGHVQFSSQKTVSITFPIDNVTFASIFDWASYNPNQDKFNTSFLALDLMVLQLCDFVGVNFGSLKSYYSSAVKPKIINED